MDKLWRKRKPPVPLDWESIQKGENIFNARLSFLSFFKKQTGSVLFSPEKYQGTSVVFWASLQCRHFLCVHKLARSSRFNIALVQFKRTERGQGRRRRFDIFFPSPPPLVFFQPNSHSFGCLFISLFESEMVLALSKCAHSPKQACIVKLMLLLCTYFRTVSYLVFYSILYYVICDQWLVKEPNGFQIQDPFALIS